MGLSKQSFAWPAFRSQSSLIASMASPAQPLAMGGDGPAPEPWADIWLVGLIYVAITPFRAIPNLLCVEPRQVRCEVATLPALSVSGMAEGVPKKGRKDQGLNRMLSRTRAVIRLVLIASALTGLTRGLLPT